MPTQPGSAQTEAGGSFARHIARLASGTTLAQVIALGFAPVLAWLYAPAAFGTWGIFVALVTILGLVACLRYEYAIVLPDTDAEAANMLAGGVLVALTFTGLVAIGSSVLASLPLWPGGTGEMLPFLWLLPPTILARGVAISLEFWNIRTAHFGRIAAIRVAQTTMTGGAQVLLGLVSGAHAGALIGAWSASYILTAGLLAILTWRSAHQLFWRSIGWRLVLGQLYRYRKFPLFDTAGPLLTRTVEHAPVFLLGLFFAPAIVGYYVLAKRLLEMPLKFIGNAIAQVFLQQAAAAYKRRALAALVLPVYQRLVACSLVPALVLLLIGRDLVVLIVGPQWAETGIYIQILSLWAWAHLLFVPLMTIYAVMERQERSLLINGLVGASVAPLLLGGWIGDARVVLAWYALTSGLVALGLVWWNMQLAGVALAQSLQVVGQTLRNGAPLLMLLGGILALQPPGWLVVAAGAASVLSALGLVLVGNPDLRQALWSLWRPARKRPDPAGQQ